MEANAMVRRARRSDALQIYQAHQNSIRTLCAKFYRPEQIARWVDFAHDPEHWPRVMVQDSVWVIEWNQRVMGFGHLRQHDSNLAEVMGLYFDPEVVGKKLGRRLMEAMLVEARGRGLKKLLLNSTKTAREFYLHMGFKQQGPEQSHELRGIQIECYAMEMML